MQDKPLHPVLDPLRFHPQVDLDAFGLEGFAQSLAYVGLLSEGPSAPGWRRYSAAHQPVAGLEDVHLRTQP
ncbi:hypothetical protein ABTL57_19620, partial [Acinetobacter baumannii]